MAEQSYEPCIPPHCPTCECCAQKSGNDDAADAKRWRELVDTWGGMLQRQGHMEIGISTPRWRVPLDVETFGEAFDRRYEMDDAEREGANTRNQRPA